MLSPQVKESAARSVLCWLATVDVSGQPIVSPKEIFGVFDNDNLVIANIASPASAKNIEANARVCVSFVDVFVQKGFKVTGIARNVKKHDPDFPFWSSELARKAGSRFPIQSVFVIQATAVESILAPSYLLHPDETSEESQIALGLRTYGVQSVSRTA